jgi:hypothetical protein
VFENRVLRRIFGPKGEEVAGGWENCKMFFVILLYTKYHYSGHTKEVAMGGNVECMAKMRNSYAGKPEERPLERVRHRWDDNIKMDF